MLLLFSVRVAEWPFGWERTVYSVYFGVFRNWLSVCVCVCVLLYLLVLRLGCGI